MGHKPGNKAPFAPWTDQDAPVVCNRSEHDGTPTCAECDHHAGFKWGSEGSAEHVHADFDTAREWADTHPRLAGVAYIQSEADGLLFVDGDDVLDPETREPHPAFVAILKHLGLTYADISVSDSGSHAIYRGELPEGAGAPTITLDAEPWGANDDPPTVEFYDGKHVCIATGRHVPGTPVKAREIDAEVLEAILRANGELSERGAASASATAFEDFDSEDYTPNGTSERDVTADIRDVFYALDQLDAKKVADRTIAREWHSDGRHITPTWASPGYSGTAVYVDGDKFVDTGDRGGYGGPACMAAIASSDLQVSDRECPGAVKGDTWRDALDALRELGYSIPIQIPEKGTEKRGGGEYDRTPLWALRKAAVALGILPEDAFIKRESDDGGTYEDFPGQFTRAKALHALEERGINHGWDTRPAGKPTDAERAALLDAPGEPATSGGDCEADDGLDQDAEPETEDEKIEQLLTEMAKNGSKL